MEGAAVKTTGSTGFRANFGCGGQVADGWTNIDKGCGPGIWCADLRDKLPFDNGQLDYAVCHHVLDLFTADEAFAFLEECFRVISPGGTLRISVANMRGAIAAAETFDDGFFVGLGKDYATVQAALDEFVYLGGARKMFLTSTLVARLLQGAGFEAFVTSYGYTLSKHQEIVKLDTRKGESLWLEGVAK